MWIVGVSSGSIYRVDPDTGATVTSFAGRFGAQIEGITFDGRCLWLSDTSSGDIMVVDHGQADLPACVFAPPSAPVVPGGGAAPASPPSSTSPPSPSNPLPTSPNGDATLPQSDDTDVTSQPACTCAFAGVAGGARSFSAIGVTAALALALARRRRH